MVPPSLGRSNARSLAHSFDRSLGRWIDRSISLSCLSSGAPCWTNQACLTIRVSVRAVCSDTWRFIDGRGRWTPVHACSIAWGLLLDWFILSHWDIALHALAGSLWADILASWQYGLVCVNVSNDFGSSKQHACFDDLSLYRGKCRLCSFRFLFRWIDSYYVSWTQFEADLQRFVQGNCFKSWQGGKFENGPRAVERDRVGRTKASYQSRVGAHLQESSQEIYKGQVSWVLDCNQMTLDVQMIFNTYC